MKTSILALAMSVAFTWPTTGYASESHNIVEQLFFGSDFNHRAHDEPSGQQPSDPFLPRRIDGLSDNVDACASYGCVGAGGGGD
jgi:hypothetical protein